MSIALLATLLTCTVFLAGCSSAEDKVYKAFRCAKVASLLGNNAAAKTAMSKVTIEMEKLTTSANPEYIGRKLNERFDEEAPLYRYGPARRTAVLTKAFESSECQSYYK
ncbi:hypothetical protein ACFIQG_13415 [Comamonas odontotermitis]